MAHPPPSSGRPRYTRTRSSTIVGTAPAPPGSTQLGPPSVDVSSSSSNSHHRSVTNPDAQPSAAAAALSNINSGTTRGESSRAARQGSDSTVTGSGVLRARKPSWPDPPLPTITQAPSAPLVPTIKNLASEAGDQSHYSDDYPIYSKVLSLYTYKPSTTPAQNAQPSPLPAKPQTLASQPCPVLFDHAALPWLVRPGDYLEIRSLEQQERRSVSRSRMGEAERTRTDGEALKGVKKGIGRDGYIFMVGESARDKPINQIHIPDSVASAFRFRNRHEVEIIRLNDESSAHIDYVELRFSQYLGRADMWRLGMSLENTTIHVGEKVTLAGGAIRADIQGVWRKSGNERIKHSSGIVTAKTKTIFRSRSAQVYLFIQLCQETYEFDEDGERYYEKIVHGFLPELFTRWANKATSHLVTVILFARVHYDAEEVSYLRDHDLTTGLIQDYAGRWCKDFFRVAIDFERRTDWKQALGQIKQCLESSEKDILMGYHLAQREGKARKNEEKRILGRWSFAYEGNVLEAVNLALNPFDEHYVDRDLSRTGLSMCVITPGTGHFAVDKNLLRLTTERMVDHGIGLDLVCLTKMPLHSVPLFSYVTSRPKGLVSDETTDGRKTKPATPDLLYYDAHLSKTQDAELADCYSIPKWVNCSFYSKTHDKPFRTDRFIPRCKMYDIQMLGILDHNLTTVSIPFLDDIIVAGGKEKNTTPDERREVRNAYDAEMFNTVPHSLGGGEDDTKSPTPASAAPSLGVTPDISSSYRSARLLAQIEGMKSTKISGSLMPGSVTGGIAKAIADSLPRQHLITDDNNLPSRSALNTIEPLDLQRQTLRDYVPAQSSSLTRNRVAQIPADTSYASTHVSSSPSTSPSARSTLLAQSKPLISISPSKASILSVPADPASGSSTPRGTPARKLNSKSSKSSFAARFGANWLFSSLTSRAQPSFATAAPETVSRIDVAGKDGKAGRTGIALSPSSTISQELPGTPRSTSQAIVVPGAPIVTPSTPPPQDTSKQRTQPVDVPTIPRAKRSAADEAMSKTPPRNSYKLSRSNDGSSWGRTANLANRTRHVTVNPCNPKLNDDYLAADGKRWQYVRPKQPKDHGHVIKWQSLCAPACLPLTTDFMPSSQDLQNFYEANSYDIACFSDQVSFLIRNDAAHANLPLAVMREMASQRLAQNFQFIVLPHDNTLQEGLKVASDKRKVLLPGESTSEGLRQGGASEILRDAHGAIYLSWSNNIHRLAFDVDKQSVTVQRFVRKTKHTTESIKYKCLVWPAQTNGYSEASAVFKYPNVDAKLNFNYLDRLVAGEEEEFTSTLRFWRTRYLLIPSGKDPLQNSTLVPKGEKFDRSEVLMTGAAKVLEIMNRHQWKPPSGQTPKPLLLLATTFDPSACVLDDGLMNELERLTSGKEVIEVGKLLEGMTLSDLATMMCQPNNGLIIRDRWWHFSVYEDTFTGDVFCDWLMKTFTDVDTREQAEQWGRSLFEKGLIEHCDGTHGFFDFNHFFYRLRSNYDVNKNKRKKNKAWFGGKGAGSPRELIEHHAYLGTSPTATVPLGRLGEQPAVNAKKRKIKMSQSVVIDLDPGKKSDRAEMAMLHADIVHNARNAFHFELNWLGVTAGLLDDLKARCATQAERYGLRFIEAPVEQIKDIQNKCAYRTTVSIPLALAPPIIPDLAIRLAEQSTGQLENFFEYAILTQKFGFVLDVETPSRYPDSLEVVYSYRGQAVFEYSQFVHRSGLALVQCIGGEEGFIWSDNRPFIAAPTRRGGAGATGDYTTKMDEARALREELQAFCGDTSALKKFYDEVTPSLPGQEAAPPAVPLGIEAAEPIEPTSDGAEEEKGELGNQVQEREPEGQTQVSQPESGIAAENGSGLEPTTAVDSHGKQDGDAQ